MPITIGNGSDSLLALSNVKFVILRVPYPMGFYAKGMDGGIKREGGCGRAPALRRLFTRKAAKA